MESVIQIANLLAALGVIVGSVFAVIRWVVPYADRVSKTMAKIDRIFDEVQPNGGKSLRDAVDKQSKDIGTIKERADRMDARQWAIVSSLTQPTWESDEYGGCVRANAALLDLVGRSQEEMAGNGWEVIVHKEDAHRVWQEWGQATAKKRVFESTYKVTNAITHKTFLVEAAAVPFFNMDKDILGWIGVYNVLQEI